MIISPENIDIENILRHVKPERKKRGQRSRRDYLDIVTAFDIETSVLPDIEQAVLYIWQWQFGLDYTVVGRTWEQLRCFIARLLPCIGEQQSLVVLVHNLSYEFQFLRTIYDFAPDEVFAVDSRKVLKCTMYEERLELRCSYLHSNMSLAEYTRKMRVEHPKLDEDAARKKYGRSFDYKTVRYPWTPLDDLELEYITNDVLGLVEAYMAEMSMFKDNLVSIPLTSTGYVRRDAKRCMRHASLGYIHSMQPSLKLYRIERDAFRGGDTHANRYMANRIIDGPVYSADRSSSYPDVLCNCDFPMTPFAEETNLDPTHIRALLRKGTLAMLLRIRLYKVCLRDPYWGSPYISRSKCQSIQDGIYDNGRVLSAAYIETAITDIDMDIIIDQYDFEAVEFDECWTSRYGPLPMPLRLLIMQYYRHKTELKGAEDEESLVLYDKMKALLNAIYGMMAQDPVKQDILFKADSESIFETQHDDPEHLLHKHNRRSPLCYQWGVWCCAWARYRLQEGIKLAGDGFIYSDTDSVKYVGEIDWSEFNAARIRDSKRSGAWADDRNGHRHYMGVFEAERSYHRFCTMGAKKYAFEYEPGKVQCTISGVSKKYGGPELGKLENFKAGFVFHKAGGTKSAYNDNPPMRWYETPEGRVEIGPNIVITDTTKTLGLTGEYMELLESPKLFYDIAHRLQILT